MTRSTNHASRILAFILLTFVGCQPAVGEINTHVDHVVYDGNGSTKTFSFSFAIFSTAHLSVVCRDTTTGVEGDQTLNSDYTMTDDDGDGDYTDGPGGSVKFVTAPASGTQVWLMRVPPLTQTTNLDGTTYVRLTTLEDCVDKIVCQIQYLQGQLYRVPMIPETERQVYDMNLPAVVDGAGYLYRASDGDIEIAQPVELADANATAPWLATLEGTQTAGQRLTVKEELGLDHVFDVRDYSAVGDGETDATDAIQAAIDAAHSAASGPVYLPPGNYLCGSPLTVYNYTKLVGVPGLTTLSVRDAGEAAIDVSGTSENVSYVQIDGIVFDADAAGCYAIKGPVDTYYLSMWRMRSCIFRAELGYGWYGLAADCLWDDCRFGHQGTPAAVHQAAYLAGSNSKVQFSNTFRKCYFAQQVGCNAAVDARLGHTLSFEACTFDLIDTRALYARGCTTVTMNACNFEAIAPADGNDVIFDIADDLEGIGHRTYLTATQCRFSLTDTHTTALAYTDSVSLFVLENSNGTITNNYYTMRAGPLYNGRVVLRNNRITGELGTLNENGSSVFEQEIAASIPFRLSAQSSAPTGTAAGDIYLDDGTNTSNLAVGLRKYSGTQWQTLGQPTRRVITKTVDIDTSPSPATDYHYDNGAGVTNTTEQVVTLTDILPAYCDLAAAKLRCYQTVTDHQSMTFDLGTTSGADEVWGGKAVDTTGDIDGTAAGECPELAAMSSATTLYLSGTPGRNWSTLASGRWIIMLVVDDYGALYTELGIE